ncbi:hypothetical protein D9Q98_006371 [Chlorella vulgaris]|uniref:Right handed beta helix domain-containing protein n=1 Tax=Chlorella vulgaris TaxID=3077 RepID=A0A9D4TK36_CHLVU|nr:hypothetical protein D9Q98_006371 [Chlorella vulgaris]
MGLRLLCVCILLAIRTGLADAARTSAVALPDGLPYQIGTLTNTLHIWVDPVSGVDAGRTGTVASQPLKTLKAAWSKARLHPSTRILIIPLLLVVPWMGAEVPCCAAVPEWLEYKSGTYKTPIIIEAAAGEIVNVNTFVAVRFCKYLYFVGIRINFLGNADGNHPFHCEGCTGLLMRRVRVRGSPTKTREAVKVNQCKGVYIEQCDFAVSTDNALDAVAWQYGHVIDSKLHDCGFGVYFKGGSAYIIAARNRIFRTGQLGIAAGFDTGFEWMVSPWLRYEAYDIKIINNLIYDINQAAGVSVYGGYNILVAHNTLYRVGASGAPFSIRQGLRSCDDDYPERCSQYHRAGGWGQPGGMPQWAQISIPNRNVFLVNNLVVNPAGYTTANQFNIPEVVPYCHEYSSGPCKPSLGGLSGSIAADAGLVIRGNYIWNAATYLGIDPDPGWETGCRNTNPSCTAALVLARNDINNATQKPVLVSPGDGNFRLKPGSLSGFAKLWAIPKWGAWAGGLNSAAGNSTNSVLTDFTGARRTAHNNAPGAYLQS